MEEGKKMNLDSQKHGKFVRDALKQDEPVQQEEPQEPKPEKKQGEIRMGRLGKQKKDEQVNK